MFPWPSPSWYLKFLFICSPPAHPRAIPSKTTSARLERFSFECRKVIGFALSTRCDWLKRFAPPFHPIRSKTKANCDALARFSRALRQPHVITSSFDWFNVLSVSYVIGQSNYFGFGFTTLKRKPLY